MNDEEHMGAEQRVFTVAEIATYLRVTTRTIRRMLHDGAPHHRIRGRVLFTRSDLDQILADGAVAAKGE